MRNYLSRNSYANLFDDFFDFHGPVDKLMKTDIKENENEYVFEVELPGISKDDLKLSLNDGYLSIEVEAKKEEGNYLRRERAYSSMSRSYYIGENITEDQIKANMNNGVLTLVVPKVKNEQKEKKYIAIE